MGRFLAFLISNFGSLAPAFLELHSGHHASLLLSPAMVLYYLTLSRNRENKHHSCDYTEICFIVAQNRFHKFIVFLGGLYHWFDVRMCLNFPSTLYQRLRPIEGDLYTICLASRNRLGCYSCRHFGRCSVLVLSRPSVANASGTSKGRRPRKSGKPKYRPRKWAELEVGFEYAELYTSPWSLFP